jgi:hypothetical protein
MGFFSRLVDEKPQVVFNLASVYAWEKTAYLPPSSKLPARGTTGSGFLTLTLLRHPVKLLPLLEKTGIRIPPYRIIKAVSLPRQILCAFRFPSFRMTAEPGW